LVEALFTSYGFLMSLHENSALVIENCHL